MSNQADLVLNISALYRNINKYFDKHLHDYDIGAGQMLTLIIINEHDGLTAQELTKYAELDKGTTTKSIQKLLEGGYIEVRQDEQDKRVKHLHTTAKSREIINNLYSIRNECMAHLLKDVDEDQLNVLETMTENSRSLTPDESYKQIRIGGLQKLTLLDFPGVVAATVFTAGCNMKCPFCHNKDLVFIPEGFQFYDPDEIFNFLERRRSILDGVAITGGEPLLQTGIFDFIAQIKDMGYKVKLDSNGFSPDLLKQAVESGNVDYIAMDIKNIRSKYSMTTGMNASDHLLDNFWKSIDYLKHCGIDHEFRTTVVKGFHTVDDLKAIAQEIKGEKYYLQQFRNSGNLIDPNCDGFDREEMEQMLAEVVKVNPTTYLR